MSYGSWLVVSNNIKGLNRTQVTLFPEVLDDFVTGGDPIRVIDVSVFLEESISPIVLMNFLLNGL